MVELKVLEGTHGPYPMGLWGGKVGLEKHTKHKKVFQGSSKPTLAVSPAQNF